MRRSDAGPPFGANPAMLTGLVLMPLVVGAGYLADRGGMSVRPDLPSIVDLRGSFEPLREAPMGPLVRPAR